MDTAAAVFTPADECGFRLSWPERANASRRQAEGQAAFRRKGSKVFGRVLPPDVVGCTVWIQKRTSSSLFFFASLGARLSLLSPLLSGFLYSFGARVSCTVRAGQ